MRTSAPSGPVCDVTMGVSCNCASPSERRSAVRSGVATVTSPPSDDVVQCVQACHRDQPPRACTQGPNRERTSKLKVMVRRWFLLSLRHTPPHIEHGAGLCQGFQQRAHLDLATTESDGCDPVTATAFERRCRVACSAQPGMFGVQRASAMEASHQPDRDHDAQCMK